MAPPAATASESFKIFKKLSLPIRDCKHRFSLLVLRNALFLITTGAWYGLHCCDVEESLADKPSSPDAKQLAPLLAGRVKFWPPCILKSLTRGTRQGPPPSCV